MYTFVCAGGCSSEGSWVVLSAKRERNAQIKHSGQDTSQKRGIGQKRLRERTDKQSGKRWGKTGNLSRKWQTQELIKDKR